MYLKFLNKFNLQHKIFIIIAGGIFSIVALYSTYLIITFENAYKKDFEKIGSLIVSNFAVNNVVSIMIEDPDLIDQSLARLFRNKDVRYAYVINANNYILKEINLLEDKEDPNLNNINKPLTVEKNIYDFWAPVIFEEETIGYVNVGMSSDRVSNELFEININFLLIAMIILAAGLLVSYAFAKSITNRLKDIIVLFEKAATGTITKSDIEKSKDEIGELTTDEIGEFVTYLNKFLTLFEEKQSNENKLSVILNNINGVIITVNNSGTIVDANYYTQEVFGLSADEIKNCKIHQFLPEITKDILKQMFEPNDLNMQQQQHIESYGLKKDRTQVDIEYSFNKISLNSKNYITLTIKDITYQKELDKTKNNFISTVSHELRTPITSIQGSLGLILGGAFGELSEQIKELLKIANNNSSRLINLINDILDLEKIQAGKMRFNFEEAKIGDLISESIKMNTGYACKYDVKINFDNSMPEAKVKVDKERFFQLVTNLLSNAIKFSHKGECVDILLSKHNKDIGVVVKDYGLGIPEDFKDKIFQAFSQADSSDIKEKGGTGLGLSICKIIAEKFGGKIGFSSTFGKGTEFYFDIPEYAQENTGEVVATPHILICENDEEVASFLGVLLKNNNITYDIAKTALAAVTLLEANHYDAVTLDYRLPDKNDTFMFKLLCNREKTKEIPIIVISENSKDSFKDKIICNCKIIDWIIKPIDSERYTNALKTTLKMNISKDLRIT